MAVALAQVIIPSVTGLSRNNFVNTFHFGTLASDWGDVDIDLMADQLEEFYVHETSSLGIDDFLSPVIASEGTWRIKFYDPTDPEPRAPRGERTFVGPATAGTPHPNEVCCCLSFKAAPESGVPAARRRGRVYIGPLNTGATTAATGDVRPNTSFITTMIGAGIWMAEVALGTDDPHWRGWSTTDAEDWQIAVVSVDNALDTQRRRGTDPSTRFSENVTIP